MRLRLSQSMLGVGLMLFGLMACAQGVYVTRGANGPVFSDKPQPGAREVQLQPLNVVPAHTVPSRANASPDAAGSSAGQPKLPKNRRASPRNSDDALPPYDGFRILFPENNGSVVANTGMFDIRLAVDPPLRLGEGHAFIISINGQPVGQRFTATEFMVPAEFWGGSLPPINQQAQLDASIVDSAGRVIMQASPAVFFMRYTTALQRPHPLHPPHPPVVVPMPPHYPPPIHAYPQSPAYPYGQLPPPPPVQPMNRPASSRPSPSGMSAASKPGITSQSGGRALSPMENPVPNGAAVNGTRR